MKKIDFSFKTKLSMPFGLFCLWAFVGLFFALDKENSVHDFYSHLIKYMIFYFILVNYFNTERRLGALSWIIIISATTFSLCGLTYEYLILNRPLSARFGLSFLQTPTNLIGVINSFAIILALNLFILNKRINTRLFLVFCILPIFSTTILTQTRGTFLSLILALGILLARKRKLLILIGIVFIVILLTTPIKQRLKIDGSIFHRISLYHYSLEIIKDYPIVGTGFGIETYGNFDLIKPEVYNQRIPPKNRLAKNLIQAPHNMFLSVTVRLGILGLILFSYILFVTAEMCWQIVKYGENDSIKCWGFCVLSTFMMFLIKGSVSPIFTHLTEVMLYTIFSMATIGWKINENIRSRKQD